jgi:hypothetical protein
VREVSHLLLRLRGQKILVSQGLRDAAHASGSSSSSVSKSALIPLSQKHFFSEPQKRSDNLLTFNTPLFAFRARFRNPQRSQFVCADCQKFGDGVGQCGQLESEA